MPTISKTNPDSSPAYASNNDLKAAADVGCKESASEMDQVYSELFNVLDDEERRELGDAQKAWSDFAEKHARFTAGLMRGGTGESLLYLEEMNSLLRARLTALREALDERSSH